MFDNLIKVSEAQYPQGSGAYRRATDRAEHKRYGRVPMSTGMGRMLGAGALGAGVGAADQQVRAARELSRKVPHIPGGFRANLANSEKYYAKNPEFLNKWRGNIGKGTAIGAAGGLGIGALLMAMKRNAARKQLAAGVQE